MYALLREAMRLTELGYSVGLSSGKNLVGKYHPKTIIDGSWDGISLILSNLVCVDFDTHLSMDVGWGRDLPPTLKDKTPRGYHLFYLLPSSSTKRISKIKWQKHVDLLTEGKRVRYGRTQADAHALCYPTPGYQRMYPEEVPTMSQLTLAPKWLQDEIRD